MLLSDRSYYRTALIADKFRASKRLVLIVIGSLVFSFSVSAQPWAIVGTPGFSPGVVYNTGIAVNSANLPYVVFQDAANSYATTVMKYNGATWNTIGAPGFSPADAYLPCISISSMDTAYVAYLDGSDKQKISVKKFNGTNWVNVGLPDFSNSATYLSLALGANDTPYVALLDFKDSSKVTVMKYNGANWINVGSPDFSNSSDDVSLAIDENTGIPYVAYTDLTNGGNVTVMNYTSGNWQVVGTDDFSADAAEYLSLVINKSHEPIVGYQDAAYADMATVMQYNGSNWITLGTAGFSKGAANYTSLALDSTGIPFLAYQDAGNGSAATVAEYNGATWVAVGSPGCTAGTADYTSLMVDHKGRLYVAFEDGSQSSYASVITYQHCNKSNPAITETVNGPDTICPGSSASISASGANTYAWNTGDSTITTTPVLTDTNAVYEIYVTGVASDGCASTDSARVYTKTSPAIKIIGADTLCNGDSTTLDASGALSYMWNTGATTSSITVAPAISTIYVASGKASNGCADTGKVSIIVNYGPPIITSATKDTICNGDSTILSASGALSYMWNNGATTSSITVSPSSTLIYLAAGKGPNGCVDTGKINVVVNYGPTITISAVKDTICKGDTVTLFASAGYSYMWAPGGATSSSIEVIPFSQTTYTTIVTASNGCKTEDSITVYVDTACIVSGLREISFSGQFNIAPNPAHNYTYITSPEGLSNAHILVFNALGSVMERFYISELPAKESYGINISDYAPGIYYLRLITDGSTAVYKLVKE